MKLLTTFMMLLASCSLIQIGGYYNPPSRIEVLSNTKYIWEEDSTENFYFLYESDTESQQYLDSAKDFFEKGYSKILSFLELKSYDKKLTLFMIDSYSKMHDLIGWKSNGIAKPEDNTVFQIFNDSIRTFGMHEFCHVISFNEWGKFEEIWVSEGLAVSSDDKWWNFELHSLVNYLYANNKFVPIKKIISDFHSHSDLYSYPECGSFIKFIKSKYGLEFVKSLWSEGEIAFYNHLQKDVSEIENEWLEEIRKYDYLKIDYSEKVYSKLGIRL
ncbi:MAG: hypothetical protein KKD86_12555 [Bacteroidetes bacterium]|nr:hypothetical protein [Bacteroidota bacterium]